MLVAGSHLQLWLTADKGLDCNKTLGEVGVWHDQSGHARDASTAQGQVPPRCNTHQLNNVDVPYFNSPTVTNGKYLDGTLDVDLGFLQNANYTIFVVERRWGDRADGSQACLFLGTTEPNETMAGSCPSIPPGHTALQMGYVYYDKTATNMTQPAIGMDVSCLGCRASCGFAPSPSAPAAFDMARWAPATSAGGGQEFWQNGKQIANDSGDTQGLVTASGGAIGRALSVTKFDCRYIGDIAEVLVFDTSISPTDQMALEGYLKAHWAQPFVQP
jgi:hypothetical protein